MCVLGGGGGGPYNHSFINQILSINWVSDIFFPRNTSVEKYKTCCSRGAYILLGEKQIKEPCKAYRRPEGQNGTGRLGDGELAKNGYGSHEVTFEQNPERVGASPMEPGRGTSKSRGPACKDTRAASPQPSPRPAFSRRQGFGFYSELDAKPSQGL